ncbi:MAG TPA: ATP-binding cassette domain-containing protein [Anaeromyxobacteraceae bacterium]|nr:ATP-binding cassette domain-containing protein [Anaeromyxobacteraceae bacterium]
MIELADVHKRFGAVQALAGASFTVRDGCITGLLGPNGAGKTTALRVLYGVLEPDRGRAAVDGRDVARARAAAQRRLGVLPHAHGLYPRLTTREHLAYFGRLHGLTGTALRARVDEALGLLDLGPIADRRTDGFSQGQRLKVALARALVHGPRNLVLDEPTAGLDVAATRALRTLLGRLRDEGRCILFSSHVMQEVSALCDEVVVMARGTVVAAGSPAELQRATGHASLEDAFVAAIGSDEGLS